MLIFEKFPELEASYSEQNSVPFRSKEYNSLEKLIWNPCGNSTHAQFKSALEFLRHGKCLSCSRIETSGFHFEDTLSFRYPDIAAEFAPFNLYAADALRPDSRCKILWTDGMVESVHSRVNRKIKTHQVDRNHFLSRKVMSMRRQGKDPYCEEALKKIDSNGGVQKSYLPRLKEEYPDLWEKCLDEDKEFLTVGSNRPVNWMCDQGHEFSSSVRNAIKRTDFCIVCSGLVLVEGINDLSSTHPLLSTYVKSPDPSTITLSYSGRITLKCEECSSEWGTRLNRHYHANDRIPGCPHCSSSSGEREVADFISDLGFSSKRNDRKVINPFEIDIFIEDDGKAVEFNGVYWHSEEQKTDKNAHLSKLMKCQSKGIKLLQVWEDDWKFRRSAVECLLEDFVLGNENEKTINSLFSCILDEADEFLNIFSLYPDKVSNLRVGVFDSGLLVSVISIIETDSNGFEIVDYCFMPGYRGSIRAFVDEAYSLGFSRGDRIITKSDNCYSDGSEFEQAGFLYKGLLEPDFKVLIQHSVRWDKEVCEDPFSEDVNRVWDAGYLLWEFIV